RGHMLARDGFVALVVDAFGSGERGTAPGCFEYHGAGLGASLMNIGRTLLGMQVYDNMRGIDLLQSLDCVDPDRIGATGASGGGNQTMWLAALDDRVKAAVPVVSVGSFESYVTRVNCICELLPGGLTFLEEWSVLGLTAPRPLLILNALQDINPTFYVAEMIRSFNGAREIYRHYDVVDYISYQAIDLTHGYWPEMRRHMLGWFRRWLKDEGEGRPCDTPLFTELPESECLCFPGNDRPESVPSIAEYVNSVTRRLVREHADAGSASTPEDKRNELEELLHIPDVYSDGMVSEERITVENDLEICKLSLESEPGIPLPLTIISRPGAKCNEAMLVVHPEGKQVALGKLSLPDMIDDNRMVVLVDLRGTGETHWDCEPRHGCRFHEAARAALWLGRTMAGDWIRDIEAVTEYLKDECGIEKVNLLAFEETGIAALGAAALDDCFASVEVREILGSYLREGENIAQSMAVHIPGILKWGDITTLVLLTRAPVCVTSPVDWAGKPYDEARIQAFLADAERLASLMGITARVSTVAI
ncbi:MAG: prolyl oligopeptidase family serine peptidase, partial [bacterium]|nr:prolyl oligopeptidase family serine peptidase [bacterium]